MNDRDACGGDHFECFNKRGFLNGDIKYSIGNVVNSSVVAIYGASWILEISGEHSVNIWLSNYYAVYLKFTQNNIECTL